MTPVFSRRMALATGLSAVAAPALAIAPPKDITLQQDFDELWETIRDRYAYFEEKATDWDRVRAIYLPRLAEVGDDEDKWMRLLGSITDELYDAHTHFAQGVPGLPRWPLSDILAEDSPAGVRVRDRRDGSAAADAGIEVGDLVIAIDGMPFAQAAALRTPRALRRPDPEARWYAINAAVGGNRERDRKLRIRSRGGQVRDLVLPY